MIIVSRTRTKTALVRSTFSAQNAPNAPPDRHVVGVGINEGTGDCMEGRGGEMKGREGEASH